MHQRWPILTALLKCSVVTLLLMALMMACVSMAAVGWWLQSPTARRLLAASLLVYMFGLVGTLGLLNLNRRRAWLWVAAAIFATLPLGLVFAVYGAPM